MATFANIDHVGGAVWKFTPSGTAPYDYYYRGKLVISQSSADYVLYAHPDNTAYEPPALEVVDANDTEMPESTRFPGYVVVQWEGIETADYYTVERYESGAWTQKARKAEVGAGYYKHESQPIAEGASEQWRVTAYDADGNASNAQSFAFTMIGFPEPPAITLSYDSGTNRITATAVS